jgi:hypothetical protein
MEGEGMSEKYREFFVAETLKGELHIFRENNKGGGLTKFVEYSALNSKDDEIYRLKKALELAKEQRNLEIYRTGDTNLTDLMGQQIRYDEEINQIFNPTALKGD